MNLFVNEIVTPPAHLPVPVDDADKALAAAVVEEIERGILWRAVVRQERRVLIDGPLPPLLELEPVSAIVSLTRWTPGDAAKVIPAGNYNFVSRDPLGATIAPARGKDWPDPKRSIGSFALTYMAGWKVTPESAAGAGDAVNEVPASVRLMVERAVAFRNVTGLGDIAIGSLKINAAATYETDQLPREIASIARAWAYRPGIFAARP